MQVIDHDQIQPAFLLLQPPSLRAHLRQVDARRVVYEHLRLHQPFECRQQLAFIFLWQKSSLDLPRVHQRLARQHPSQQTLLRHLEREHRHNFAVMHCRVLRDVDRPRRLPHRRPSRNNNQLGILQPARHPVELDVMRLQTGNLAALFVELIDRPKARRNDLRNPRKPALDRAVRHIRQLRLDIAQHCDCIFALVGRSRGPIMEDRHQLPQQALVLHDPDIALDVEVPRNPLAQIREIRRSANRIELPLPLKVRPHRRVVHRVPDRHQIDNAPIHPLM